MFQAMGNTIPSLITSGARIVIVAVPVLLLARSPGFTLRWIWYISAGAVVVQLAMNMWLLQREYRRRLSFGPLLQPHIASPPESTPILSS
jgi:Na+-driven multidrug efflux pump